MSTLTPSGGRSRRGRGGTPVILVGVLALLIGAGVGWYLTNRDPAETATPSPSGCPSPVATPSPGASESPAASGKPLPAPSTITVDVFNSTDRQGLAKTTADELERRDFVIGDVANDPLDDPIAGTAEVRYGPKGKRQATVVAAQVPESTLVNDKRADKTVSLALGEAYDGLATPEQVAAQLSPSPSPTC
jgi:hypothetical protein